MSISSAEFLRAALQRLNAAEFLLGSRYNLDAMYLAGYTIECSFKALILEHTPALERADVFKQITAGSRSHSFEFLAGLLRARHLSLPLDLVRGIRRAAWSTNIRYESGRRTTKQTKDFLLTAREVYNWVRENMP